MRGFGYEDSSPLCIRFTFGIGIGAIIDDDAHDWIIISLILQLIDGMQLHMIGLIWNGAMGGMC